MTYTIPTATRARLGEAVTMGKELPAAMRDERNVLIAREVHNGADKAELAAIVHMGVPQINRIARTSPDAPADAYQDAPAPAAPKASLRGQSEVVYVTADVQVSATVGAFESADGGHVPPRARVIRRTGSTIAFGHASQMGFPQMPLSARDWVSQCVTHGASAHYETRSEARYQDGTEYCMDCAAI